MIIVAIAIIIGCYVGYKMAQIILFKRFDDTIHEYPSEFTHEGEQYRLTTEHEYFKNHLPGAILSRSTIYLNGIIAVVISRMRKTVITHRSIDVNQANKHCLDILKSAKGKTN